MEKKMIENLTTELKARRREEIAAEKTSPTPEEQVDQPTWTLRKPTDPEIRQMIAAVMRLKKMNRSEAVLYLVRASLKDVMQQALAEERAVIRHRERELDRLCRDYQLGADGVGDAKKE